VLLLTWAFMSSATAEAGGQECAVVVSPDVPITDVSMEQLRRIFLFKQRFWKGGGRITILYSETSLEPGSFLLDEIYRSDYPSLKRLILEKLYQSEIELAPKVVASDQSVLRFVGSGRGLIAIVAAESITGDGIKLLTVEGKRPGAQDYPLRTVER
jgi:hypothetical protein